MLIAFYKDSSLDVTLTIISDKIFIFQILIILLLLYQRLFLLSNMIVDIIYLKEVTGNQGIDKKRY